MGLTHDFDELYLTSLPMDIDDGCRVPHRRGSQQPGCATRRSSPSRMSNRSPLPAGAEDLANQLGPVVVNLSGCPLYSVGKGLEHVVTALGSA